MISISTKYALSSNPFSLPAALVAFLLISFALSSNVNANDSPKLSTTFSAKMESVSYSKTILPKSRPDPLYFWQTPISIKTPKPKLVLRKSSKVHQTVREMIFLKTGEQTLEENFQTQSRRRYRSTPKTCGLWS